MVRDYVDTTDEENASLVDNVSIGDPTRLEWESGDAKPPHQALLGCMNELLCCFSVSESIISVFNL